jgi:hypothetical protein
MEQIFANFLSALNPIAWIDYAVAGLWNEVWKYGTGIAILILSGAVVVFNPLGLRNAGISVFFLTALVLGVYSWGARDGATRSNAQCRIAIWELHRDYIFTPRPKPKVRGWF